MSQHLSGKAAFPLPHNCAAIGLTYREYYAGLALQGLCANVAMLKLVNSLSDEQSKIVDCTVGLAIALADELITQLD